MKSKQKGRQMTIQEWLDKNAGKYGDREKTIAACVKALGVTKKAVQNKWLIGETRPAKQAAKPGRCLDDFKREYDKNTYIPQKIRAALTELGEAWEYESEFVRRSGVNYTDLNLFREEFQDFCVFAKRENKKIWTGSRKLAGQMRELL